MVTYLYIGKGRKSFFAKKDFAPIFFFIKKDFGVKLIFQKKNTVFTPIYEKTQSHNISYFTVVF